MNTIVWADPPASAALPAGEIHVWRAALAQAEEVVQRLTRVLSDDEQRRSDGFHYARDRCSFSVGRGVLRMLVGRYLRIAPARVKFEYGRWGKPRLAGTLGKSGLRFNAAHSDGLFLCAFTSEQEIGIDLERIVPVPELLQIAELAFSPAEHAALCALPAEARTQAFFDCWTRREAWLKAGGDGMAGPRGRGAARPAKGERRGDAGLLSQGGAEDRWSGHAFTPASEYVAALAVEGPLSPVQAWQWSSATR